MHVFPWCYSHSSSCLQGIARKAGCRVKLRSVLCECIILLVFHAASDLCCNMHTCTEMPLHLVWGHCEPALQHDGQPSVQVSTSQLLSSCCMGVHVHHSMRQPCPPPGASGVRDIELREQCATEGSMHCAWLLGVALLQCLVVQLTHMPSGLRQCQTYAHMRSRHRLYKYTPRRLLQHPAAGDRDHTPCHSSHPRGPQTHITVQAGCVLLAPP